MHARLPTVLTHLTHWFRGGRGGVVAALLLAALAAPALAAEPLTAQTPSTVAARGVLIGRTAPTQAITLAITLQPKDPAALDAFVADLYTPSSPDYHRYLTPRQFTDRFFDPASRAAVVQYLQGQGLTTSDPGVGATIGATGTATQTERAFQVTLSDYRDATTGQTFYAADLTPALSVAIAPLVAGITGLDNVPAGAPGGFRAPDGPVSDVAPRTNPPLVGCAAATSYVSGHSYASYLPNQLATAYRFDDLYALGVHGERQTVAVFESTDYHDSNPATYQSCFGTSVPLTRVQVDAGMLGNYADEGEAVGDIEDLTGLAPNLAGILVYETPNTNAGYIDAYQKIANDNRASVVSTSWYNCEPNISLSRKNGENMAFTQMAMQGQTIFAAAGDTGSTACKQYGGPNPDALALQDPASNPYVTGVGGTHLTTDNTNAWSSERVWNNAPGSTYGGGGGLSILFSRPAWQTGPGTTNGYSNGMREDPDVTATADSQYTFYVASQGGWGRYYGTSFAAPLWAAGAALLNQFLITHGGAAIGLLNPALYTILASPAVDGAFHDIPAGSSNCTDPASTCGTPGSATGTYPATAHYDLASGIGAPEFGGILKGLSTPVVSAVNMPSGPVGGGTPVTITATTGASATSATVAVSVTNPSGAVGALANGYRYAATQPSVHPGGMTDTGTIGVEPPPKPTGSHGGATTPMPQPMRH